MFVFTLCFRGWELGHPNTFVFDEIYYANDALDLFTHGAESTFVGHPPLGKWLIAIGFVTGRFSPFAWRSAVLVAGAVVVVLVFLCVERLTSSMLLGVAASAFVLTDGVAQFTGRYAHLDGFATLFSTAALAALLVTRSKPMSYRIACVTGMFLGAAAASKWSVLPVLPLGIAVCFIRARRTSDTSRALAMAAAAVGVACVVYFGSYTPWVVGGATYGNCTVPACTASAWDRLERLPVIQKEMYQSEADLDRGFVNQESAWRWALQDRPFGVLISKCADQRDGHCIRGASTPTRLRVRGNEVLWILAVPVALLCAALRLRWKRVIPGAGLAFAWAFTLWLPWLRFPHVYLYYSAPVVPPLAIAVLAASAVLLPRRLQPLLVIAATAAGALLFFHDRVGPPWWI